MRCYLWRNGEGLFIGVMAYSEGEALKIIQARPDADYWLPICVGHEYDVSIYEGTSFTFGAI